MDADLKGVTSLDYQRFALWKSASRLHGNDGP
jgi:hypothetical protein